MSTGNEELKTTDNLPFEESQTSKKSVKAKKTALRPTSKKKNGEDTDATVTVEESTPSSANITPSVSGDQLLEMSQSGMPLLPLFSSSASS